MIRSLPVTIIIEGVVGLVYAFWRKKPVVPIIVTSIFVNLITQSILWIALNVFFRHYIATLSIAEVLVVVMEGVFLSVLRANRLNIDEAFVLSLMMNGCSFGLGLFLRM